MPPMRERDEAPLGTPYATAAAVTAEVSPARLEAAAIPARSEPRISLLTGGIDKHYAVGLAAALAERGVGVDFIGSDEVDGPEVRGIRGVRFLNLRGDQREHVALRRKVIRVLIYYARLVTHAAVVRPRVLHILWNNKFELFDRTVLMLYYRLLGNRVTLTAHNVNAAKRDARDTWLNRVSLRIQYRLCDQIFVHTERMRAELIAGFGVPPGKITVIPYGINEVIPTRQVTRREARILLGLREDDRVLLFFGQIAPYKGLQYLVSALTALARTAAPVSLVIAGKIKKGHAEYWRRIQRSIAESDIGDRVYPRIEFIPDADVEPYFVAADAVVIPYIDIFQSGIPFLAFSFGVPVIATDVGSLREDIIDGKTGFICRPGDSGDLAETIRRYFASDLYKRLDMHRSTIQEFARERHSWTSVSKLTAAVYDGLRRQPS